MLNRILRRASVTAVAIAALWMLLIITTAAFGNITEFIEAKKGGKIDIAEGVQLRIAPKALEEDTPISADMAITSDFILFEFGPDGTEFAKPAELRIKFKDLEDWVLDDFTLYGEDGEEIEPVVKGGYATYDIWHFSIYYHRRR